MKKMFFAVAVAALSMASCSKEPSTVSNNSDQILLGGSVMSVEARGAGAINSGYTSFVAGVVAYDANITAPIFNQAVTFVNGTKSAVSGQKYPATGNVNFVGYAPETATVNSGVASFTIDGKDDVMYASEKTGSKADATLGTHPELAFAHKLTQLQFKVKADDATAQSVWSTIKKITIEDQHNTFDLDLTTGTLTATGTANNSIAAFEGSLAVDLTAQVADYVMVEAGKASVKAIVVSEKGGSEVSIAVNIPAAATFVAGTAYEITLNLKGTENIQVSATVAEWLVGTPQTVDVE